MPSGFKEHFNELSSIYNGYAALATNSDIRDFLIQEAKPYVGKLALDAGIGTGNFSSIFKESENSIVGIDISLEMLREARHRGILPVCNDAKHMPFRDETFDTVMARQFLQYLDIAGISTVLAEFHRILKPGAGTLILNHVTCPTEDTIEELRKFMSVENTITTFLSTNELATMVRSTGFTIEKLIIHKARVSETNESFCAVRRINKKNIDQRLSYIASTPAFELIKSTEITYNRHYSLIVARASLYTETKKVAR